MTDESPEYGVVMPFVTVTSVGGPHDDEAYTAGYEEGRLYSELAAAARLGVGLLTRTIQSVNQPQADLIAIRCGFMAKFAETEVEGWTSVVFELPGEGSLE